MREDELAYPAIYPNKLTFIVVMLLIASVSCCTGELHQTKGQTDPGGSFIGAESTSSAKDDGAAAIPGVAETTLGEISVIQQEPPLFSAVRTANISAVRLIITQGADVNAANIVGRTPLHEASFYRRKRIAGLLIAAGARVDAKDMHGMTPLHSATLAGSKPIVALLIEKGAELNAKSNSGHTALHLAAAIGDESIVALVVGNGANVNAHDSLGKTPLLYAAIGGYDRAAALLGRCQKIIASGVKSSRETKSCGGMH